MPTRTNHFTDVLFSVADHRAFYTAMNTANPDFWINDERVTAGDGPRVGFDLSRVGTDFILGATDGIALSRFLVADWAEMIAIRPPMTVHATADYFGPKTFADPENPTEAELYQNDVFYLIKDDDAAVDEVRKHYPESKDDGEGGTVKQPLAFAAFEPGRTDVRGAKDPKAAGGR